MTTDTNATDALNKMVSGGFRHLPCLNVDGKKQANFALLLRELDMIRICVNVMLGKLFSRLLIGDVVGLLDITKCLYEALEKLEKANKSSKQLVDALQGMQSEWSQSANPDLQNYVDLVSASHIQLACAFFLAFQDAVILTRSPGYLFP